MSTPYKVFLRGIPIILRNGPLSHKDIARALREEFPDFCNDLIPCPHVNDKSGHPEWDHLARNAEQGLKRRKIIFYNRTVKKWGLVLKRSMNEYSNERIKKKA
ncbi:MAG: hypothetical protein NTW12_13080 [Deltaproteobacteria bacterium]|nr:hypothetical protein [Deltaproteobacteria bacterium]